MLLRQGLLNDRFAVGPSYPYQHRLRIVIIMLCSLRNLHKFWIIGRPLGAARHSRNAWVFFNLFSPNSLRILFVYCPLLPVWVMYSCGSVYWQLEHSLHLLQKLINNKYNLIVFYTWNLPIAGVCVSVEMIKINSKSKKPNYFFFFSFLKVKTESNINKLT